MNTRNTILGVVVAALLAGGIWYWTRPTPEPAAVAAPKSAVAPAAPKPAAPVAAPKMSVVAPTAPAVVVASEAKPAAPAATAPDQELKTAMADLIAALESPDKDAFIDNYIAPSMMDMMHTMVESQAQTRGNLPPGAQAQIEQQLQQQLPQIIAQAKQELAQDPRSQEQFQKLADALKGVQDSAPEMNEAGDQATYKLNITDGQELPPAITMVRRDGKWTLDFMSMAKSGAGL